MVIMCLVLTNISLFVFLSAQRNMKAWNRIVIAKYFFFRMIKAFINIQHEFLDAAAEDVTTEGAEQFVSNYKELCVSGI